MFIFPTCLQVLASKVRTTIHSARTKHRSVTIQDGYNPSTRKMINRWVGGWALLEAKRSAALSL